MHFKTKILRIILIVIPLLLATSAQAQQYRVHGLLTDKETGEPLVNAHVTYRGTPKGTVSDARGYFSIGLNSLPVELVVIHVAYDTLRIPVDTVLYSKELENKTKSWTLNRARYDIPEARISAYALKLFGNDTHYITDYEFLGNRIILLGFRNNNILRPELFVSDLSGSILHVQPFTGARELVADCFGNIHVLTGLDCCQLSVEGDSCRVRKIIPLESWENEMKPALIYLGRSVVWEMADVNRLWMDYQILSAETKTARTFFSSGYRPDASLAKALDSQLKFLYRAIGEYRAPISAPAGPLHNPVHDIIPDIEFRRRIELKPVNTPIFLVKLKLVVFNFPYDRIDVFNFFGDSVATTAISRHKSPEWNKLVIQDDVTEKLYLVMKSGQKYSLDEIDPATGEVVRNIPIINYPDIDHIRIHDGQVYFLYEDLFGVKAKTLYLLRQKGS